MLSVMLPTSPDICGQLIATEHSIHSVAACPLSAGACRGWLGTDIPYQAACEWMPRRLLVQSVIGPAGRWNSYRLLTVEAMTLTEHRD